MRLNPARSAPTLLAAMRPEDRWRMGETGRRVSSVAVILVAASLGVHAVILAVTMFGSRPVPAPVIEIPVEIVQEPATPAKPPAPAPAPQAAKPPAPPPAPDPAAAEREALAKELAALKAEHEALASEQGPGPLRDSMRAIALPSLAAEGEDGELTSYQAIVFSALARAKEHFPEYGRAGTSGVRFSVDETGRLVAASIAVSSGSKTLDDEALAIVRAASPFPKPPAGAEREFSANVAYAAVAR